MAEYRPLFGSYLLATIGEILAKVALTVLVYERTGSALLSALTFAISYLPWVLGGPVLATLADRFPRQRVMVISDLLRAGFVALMAVPGMPLPAMLALLLLVALASPPYEAARSALTADVLTGDRYAVAVSLGGVVLQGSQLVGFLLGGVLVTTLSPSVGLLLNAAAFALSGAWLAVGLRARPAPAASTDATPPASVWSDLVQGLLLVVRSPRLLSVVALLWLGVLATNAHEGIGPALSVELVGDPSVVGLVLAAHPVGAVVGSVVVGRFCPPALRERLLVPLLLLSLGALVAAGLGAGGLEGRTAVVVLVGFLAVAGFGDAWLIPLNVAFVRAVPPAMRGRAFGVAAAGVAGVQGLGALAAGAAAGAVDPTTVVALAGLVGLPLVAVPLVALRRTRPPAGAALAGPSTA